VGCPDGKDPPLKAEAFCPLPRGDFQERAMTFLKQFVVPALGLLFLSGLLSRTVEAGALEYRVLATQKTSTMQKELNAAGAEGFRFEGVMGGNTGWGGSEAVVVMSRDRTAEKKPGLEYKLLATSKTSTMQKEMQQAADEGFEYKGQTVFETTFGGKEVVVIMERDRDGKKSRHEYKLLATTKTSSMQRELVEAAEAGFRFVGMTVAETAFGGKELVTIVRRDARE